MKITNIMGLPQALVDACSPNPHNKEGCISATTLKSGVREIILSKRHWDEISEDVSDRIFAIFGTAVHALLEKESPDTFVEEQFSQKIGKYTLTGRLDCYDMKQKIIFDYKTASTWKYKYNDFDDWKFQGLVYAWLLKKQGLEVNECRFVAMFKDFSKTKAKVEACYPPSPVFVYKFDVTDADLEEIEKKIKSKIKQLEESENLKDDELPLCSDEERWAKPSTWAVMKNGRKTAVRVFENEESADAFLKSNADTSLFKVERKSSDGKCDGYCSCCEFCSYWKENYGNKAVEVTA